MNEQQPPASLAHERPRVSLKTRFEWLRKTYRDNAVKPEAILLSQPGEFDALCDIMKAPLPPEGERAFIVSSCYGWGKGPTIEAAKKACRTHNPRRGHAPAGGKKSDHSSLIYRAKLVHRDTTCDGGGGINYWPEYPPVDLGEV